MKSRYALALLGAWLLLGCGKTTGGSTMSGAGASGGEGSGGTSGSGGDAGDAGSGAVSGSGAAAGSGGSDGFGGSGVAGAGAIAGNAGQAGMGGVAPHCDEAAIIEMPLRRLTQLELERSVSEVFGSSALLQPAQPWDDFGGTLAIPKSFSPIMAQELVSFADAVAMSVIASLDDAAPCQTTDGDIDCATRFLEVHGLRAYRRPLTSADLAHLGSVYMSAADHAAGIAELTRALVLSPYFLFRIEYGAMPEVGAALGGYEIAARLSYLLWAAPPDDELLDAAERGTLVDPAELAAQATRLLKDERFFGGGARFFEELLGLHGFEESASAVGLDAPLIQAMRQETRAFLEGTLSTAPLAFRDLLAAPISYLNDRLADHYGVPLPNSDSPVPTDLDPTAFSSLVTQGTFTVTYPTPTRRGAALRRRLLCDDVPSHPGALPIDGPLPDQPWREYLESVSDPACAACHRLSDPIGFALLAFDEQGRYAPGERTDGTLTLSNGELSFEGISDLMSNVVDLDQTRACMTRRWMEAALGRALQPAEEKELECLSSRTPNAAKDLFELILGVVARPWFRQLGQRNERTPPSAATATDAISHAINESGEIAAGYQGQAVEELERYGEALRTL